MKFLVPLILILANVAHAHSVSLDFLGRADSDVAWVLDSAFDPTPLVGELVPEYAVGDNSLTRINLNTGEVDASIPLGESGPVLAFDLSPDGNRAVAAQIGTNALLLIEGLKHPETAVVTVYPLPLQPLSLAFTIDGRRAAIGYQTDGGEAMVALVDGVASGDLHVHAATGLGVTAAVLTAVEAVAFSQDGSRVITQTALHDVPPPSPGFFTPRIALQSHAVWENNVVAAPAFFPDRQSLLPPSGPFAELPTGVALGDFALTCDGKSMLVPVPGALDLGQPDARILVIDGVNSGVLNLRQTLTPADGVDVAPFQIDLAADCERAIVTNAFAGTVTKVQGISSFELSLNVGALLMPFPSEPAITADLSRFVVQHTRPPINGVPPSNITVYELDSFQSIIGPIFGSVRSWVQAKDRTLATWPAGLADRIVSFHLPRWQSRLLRRQIRRAIRAAHKGKRHRSARHLNTVRWVTYWLWRGNYLTPLQADIIDGYVDQAIGILRDGGQ